MRVLQLIDSLRSGGAERMSVSYANALAKRIDASFLCCTRMEGLLKSQLSPEVDYLFLNKNYTLDLQAFLKLRKFVKENEVDLIHAHGSSWFLALMVKKSLGTIKLVWHDHWGERALKKLHPGILKPASRFFDGILAVNPDLEEWARKNMKTLNIISIPNFVPDYNFVGEIPPEAANVLKGNSSIFKIICLANLRAPKDHMTLLRAFTRVLLEYPDISLHLVGKDENDIYSQSIKFFIKENWLQEKVFLYGEQGNVVQFLSHADMGVLSSKTEGLPVALLEYGVFGLPVVCTGVGQCEEVIGDSGFIVPPENPEVFANAITYYLQRPEIRKEHSIAFKHRVSTKFSKEKVMNRLISFYSKI